MQEEQNPYSRPLINISSSEEDNRLQEAEAPPDDEQVFELWQGKTNSKSDLSRIQSVRLLIEEEERKKEKDKREAIEAKQMSELDKK